VSTNRSIQEIPEYLSPFIVRQDPALYTPIDHASWRFILKVSRDFFKKYAHQKYQDGLRETGISLERIPLISEMDECLNRFGWRAVAVSGFIPPGVFMEFLSLGILPIACDMRSLEHLAYTPAPDIVHEAAGHAPIVADPEYARYLRSYGELARKAIFSSKDMDVYNAIRHLSDTKENPASTSQQIQDAEAALEKASAAVDYISEATELSRMGWWTFEYGLIGKVIIAWARE
jgi:phenylalanine-4-hydroxylase